LALIQGWNEAGGENPGSWLRAAFNVQKDWRQPVLCSSGIFMGNNWI
jgi:hypothetical protein